MPSDSDQSHKSGISVGWMVLIIAFGWLVLISWLHYTLNFEHGERPVVRMGYMPVITNLACPLLDQATKEGTGVRFEAPFGPIRAEYGWKLDREPDESRGQFHFAIGANF